jgi:hypothetical protein
LKKKEGTSRKIISGKFQRVELIYAFNDSNTGGQTTYLIANCMELNSS